MAAEAIVVRSPESTRPWQHVLEPLGGYLQLAERLHVVPHLECHRAEIGHVMDVLFVHIHGTEDRGQGILMAVKFP